jgi:hypothetical protein
MKHIRSLIWIVLASIGLGSAQAQSFSIGAALGFPTLLEARAAYEAESFGVRGYVATFSDVVLGADVYLRFTDSMGSGLRLGAGAMLVTGNNRLVGIRGLLGAVFAFSPNFSLALEFRPTFPLNLSSGTGHGFIFFFLLASVSIGFEFKL